MVGSSKFTELSHYTISMVISFSLLNIAFSRSEVARDSVTFPLMVFLPTSMHPAESALVVPLCMSMPKKWGTSCRYGNTRLNRGL